MNITRHAALILTLVTAGAAHGQVLFSNFGPNYTYGTTRWEVSSGVCSLNALAVRFKPSQTALFGDAKLALAHSPYPSGSTPAGPNQLTVELRAESSGAPGAVIEGFNVTGLTEADVDPYSSVITVNSVSHPLLDASTYYWLVLSTADPTTCDWWFYNSTLDLTDATNIAFAYNGSPNGPWQAGTAAHGQLGIPRPTFQIDGFKGAQVTLDAPYQIRYASNLTQGDSVVNITNTGANGNNLYGPGFGTPAGNICVNVYAFSPDEQMISCCSCLVTPNGLVHVTANNDLVSNTLTGIRPNSIVIKLVATATGKEKRHIPGDMDVDIDVASYSGSSCNNSAALVGSEHFPVAPGGMLAWGTTLHSSSNNDPPTGPASSFSITETPFIPATLTKETGLGYTSATEIESLRNRCTNIVGNGSSFGICRSCRLGGLGGAKL